LLIFETAPFFCKHPQTRVGETFEKTKIDMKGPHYGRS